MDTKDKEVHSGLCAPQWDNSGSEGEVDSVRQDKAPSDKRAAPRSGHKVRVPVRQQVDEEEFDSILGLVPQAWLQICLQDDPSVVVERETKPSETQVGGNHYKDCPIQPSEYIIANDLGWFEGNAVKYITRHRVKGGEQDILKAIHYLQLLLEDEYGQ